MIYRNAVVVLALAGLGGQALHAQGAGVPDIATQGEPAKRPATRKHGYLLDGNGVAAQGYDVVAYLTGSKAVKGSAAHRAEYAGATWYFSDAQHRKLFEEHPAKYVPAYGGHCAFGVAAKGAFVPPNPATFRIQDGRLLLFFNGEFKGQLMDTSKMWDDDRKAMLAKADDAWPGLVGLLLDGAGVAAQGYDVVAYFDNRALKGSKQHEAEYAGAKYRFSSEGNREKFLRQPERYLPEYGGYCAFGVSAKGAKFMPNPETFLLQHGRLLLFFNGDHEGQVVDTSKMWNLDPRGHIQTADKAWPGLAAETQ